MINYYEKYGKVIISKGTKLYHWRTNNNNINNNLYDNSFFCLDNSHWKDTNKTLYTYKLLENLEIILTITNNTISNPDECSWINNFEKGIYNVRYKTYDTEVLTDIYNDFYKKKYTKHGDVSLKTNKTDFKRFCNKLKRQRYNGLFNYIDCEKGMFEIVIFEPNNYLHLLSKMNYDDVKFHNLRDCKRIMSSSKINFECPYSYEFKEKICKYNSYPSIFYYIYKKLYKANL
jgi:hypothetical protein